MVETAQLGLPFLQAAQAQKHVTVNESLRIIDAVAQISVISRTTTAPPGSPAEGDRYIVGSGATGAWDGWDLNVAVWMDGDWFRLVPRDGWIAWVEDETSLYIRDGANWVDFGVAAGLVTFTQLEDGSVDLLGVNSTADTTNRLSVASPGSLFTHGTTPGGHLMTINKSAVGQNAGITLQQGFSTRALFGLLGNNDLEFRVSHNGSAFTTALAIRHNSAGQGNVGIGTGADANNRLTVSGQSMLFTNSGDLRFTFNKGAPANDCVLTFQSSSSARALVGLLGSDDFAFSVSPNGSTYYQSMLIDRNNGLIRLPVNPVALASINFDQYLAVTWTKISFNTSIDDRTSMFNAGNNDFTVPAAGLYRVGFNMRYVRNGTNNPIGQWVRIVVNGTPTPRTFVGRSSVDATNDGLGSVFASDIILLAANDVVTLEGRFGNQDGFFGENSVAFVERIL